MKDHAGVRREFVLTAFSIHPSAEIYRRVEEEAVASGKASPHSTPTSQESMEVGVLSEGLSSLSSEEPDVKETAMDYSVNNDSQDSGAFVEVSLQNLLRSITNGLYINRRVEIKFILLISYPVPMLC